MESILTVGRSSSRVLLNLVLASTFGAAVAEDGQQTHELANRLVLYDGLRGASCSHFLANAVPWERRGGDWQDAQGKRFGGDAFAVASLGAKGTIWDVSKLVRKWIHAEKHTGGFFLKVVAGSGFTSFSARESKNVADWPMLVLQFADGTRQMLKPSADTHLDCSTYTSRGSADAMLMNRNSSVLLQFALPTNVGSKALTRAQLVLSNAVAPGGGGAQVGIFEIATPTLPFGPIQQGLAANYSFDRGIERDQAVMFTNQFDQSSSWKTGWSKDSSGEVDIVKDDAILRFTPLIGSALRINVKKGSNLGADLRIKLKDLGGEPDELYFRYYLRLADDWNPTIADGKMPGLAGTYNQAGWGGRRVNGANGWSMRGSFLRGFETGNPLRGLTQLGSYAYHADMEGTYGDIWPWTGALLERNRWYCIEQYVRLNTPKEKNGILRVWIDGRLAMEHTNLRLRTVESLHIEWVWFDVYHGGAEVSLQDQHLYIDNVVVARRYIGPMTKAPER